ncbi:MAG: hypothetical protein OEY89_15595 [Gammaproteobacteria bacterium]|nr:hypothetical protein [Gammaproteobacteria bacterium]
MEIKTQTKNICVVALFLISSIFYNIKLYLFGFHINILFLFYGTGKITISYLPHIFFFVGSLLLMVGAIIFWMRPKSIVGIQLADYGVKAGWIYYIYLMLQFVRLNPGYFSNEIAKLNIFLVFLIIASSNYVKLSYDAFYGDDDIIEN